MDEVVVKGTGVENPAPTCGASVSPQDAGVVAPAPHNPPPAPPLIAIFNHCQCRVIRDDTGRPGFVLADICAATGIDRSGANHLIRRDEELFSGHFWVDVTSTQNGNAAPEKQGGFGLTLRQPKTGYARAGVVLDTFGVVALLTKVRSSRIRDDRKRARILSFQRWAFQTLADILEGRTPDCVVAVVARNLVERRLAGGRAYGVRALARALGVPLSRMQLRIGEAVRRVRAGMPLAAYDDEMLLRPITAAQFLRIPAVRRWVEAPYGTRMRAGRRLARRAGIAPGTLHRYLHRARRGRDVAQISGHGADALRRLAWGAPRSARPSFAAQN